MISFVIPTFNRKNITKKILDKIISLFVDKQIEIIIADGNSSDGTKELSDYSNIVKYYNFGKLSWWTKSVKYGLTKVNERAKVVVVLNDDVELTPDLFEMISNTVPSDIHIYSGFQILNNNSLFKGLSSNMFGNLTHAKNHLDSIVTNGSFFFFSNNIRNKVYMSLNYNVSPHIGADLIMFLNLKLNNISLIIVPKIAIKQTNFTNYSKKLSFMNFLSHISSPYNYKMRKEMIYKLSKISKNHFLTKLILFIEYFLQIFFFTLKKVFLSKTI